MMSGLAWLTWEVSRRIWADGATSACETSADYFNDTMFAVAQMAATVVFVLVSMRLRGALRWCALAAGAGAAASGIGNMVEHCGAEPFLLLYVGGSMVYVLASVALGVTLFATGQLGRWPGLLLGAAPLGSLMLDTQHGGAAVTGVIWLAFGLALLLTRDRDDEGVRL